MKQNDDIKFDSRTARRGAVVASAGKTRVTIYLDDDVIEYFRRVADDSGRGYQTEINAGLRQLMEQQATLKAARHGVDVIEVGQLDSKLNGLIKSVNSMRSDLASYASHGPFVKVAASKPRQRISVLETTPTKRSGMGAGHGKTERPAPRAAAKRRPKP